VSTVDVTDEVAGPVPTRAKPVTAPAWWRRLLPWGLLAAGLLAGIALQTQLYTADERVIGTVYMFIALATAWNLIGGFTGYPWFGQVGMFGLGAYATALFMVYLHLSFWLSMALSAVLAGLFAALIGTPLLRLKGHYFAIATLGVAEGLRELVNNLPRLTGGGGGITIPALGKDAPTQWLGNDGFYLLFLVIAVGSVAIALLVSKSRAGYALRAVAQDEDAAAAMGINTTRAKTLAFACASAITGAVGSAAAFQIQALYPDPAFDTRITELALIMVMIGGAGTVLGPVIGAVAVQYMSEWLRSHYTNAHTFILGGLIILAVVLLPQGFINYLSDAVRTRRFSLLSNVRRYRL
jgi:branched-chain amino acid transport system permease protein